MKKNQLILLSVFFLVSGLTYWRVFSNQKEPVKENKEANTEMFVPTRIVNNSIHKIMLSSFGQISPNQEIDVAFEVQGKLIQGFTRMKPGVSFNAGQVMFEIDKEEALANLKARKSQLANLVISILPDIELDYIESLDKWKMFLNQLVENKNLPELPIIEGEKQKMLVTSRNIYSEYFSILSMEKRMLKYSYKAPFNGTVLEVFSEPGSIVNPGVRICKIAKTGEMEIKVPIALKSFDLFKNAKKAILKNNANEIVGEGRILRISDVVNSKTQSIDVFYSVIPNKGQIVYNDQFLSVEINKEIEEVSFVVPRNAVKENAVSILRDGQIVKRNVNVLAQKSDSLIITGLSNGDEVIMEGIIPNMDVTKYTGIRK